MSTTRGLLPNEWFVSGGNGFISLHEQGKSDPVASFPGLGWPTRGSRESPEILCNTRKSILKH